MGAHNKPMENVSPKKAKRVEDQRSTYMSRKEDRPRGFVMK